MQQFESQLACSHFLYFKQLNSHHKWTSQIFFIVPKVNLSEIFTELFHKDFSSEQNCRLSLGWSKLDEHCEAVLINVNCSLLTSISWGWMDEQCFRPLLCTVKAELGRGQPGLMRWIWDETLPQSSIDRSTFHSAAHCATKWASGCPLHIVRRNPYITVV